MTLQEYAAQTGQGRPQEQQPATENWLDIATAQVEALDNARTIANMKAAVNAAIEQKANPVYLLSVLTELLFGE